MELGGVSSGLILEQGPTPGLLTLLKLGTSLGLKLRPRLWPTFR